VLSPPDAALAHYSDRQSLVTAGAEVAAQMWADVNPARIVESWTTQVPELTTVLSGAQFGAARQADSYLDEVAAWQDADPATESLIDAKAFAGTASDGRGLMSLLMSPAFSALQVIASGMSSRQALSLGGQHLDTIARTQVADAGRLADGVSLTAHKGLDGYVRTVVGKTCSRCIVLAGRHYRWNAGFQRHPHCDCIHLPCQIADAGKLLQDPHKLYQSMTDKQRSAAGWSEADQRALADGADIFQVTNAHRGVYTAGGREFTTEGVTKRGFAGSRLGAKTKRVARLTPEQIYLEAGENRDEALRLLYRHGYLIQEPAVVKRAADLVPARPIPSTKRAEARARQAEITRRGDVAELLAELDALIAKKAERAIFVQRLDLAASTGVADAATLAQLRRAVDAGDTTKLRAAITRVGKKESLTAIGRAGTNATFDEAIHEALGDLPPAGTAVTIVRRGTVLDLNGEQIQLTRAQTVLAEVPAKKVAGNDLSKMTVPKLRELAKERGIAIPSKALKADIVKLLDGTPVKKVAVKATAKKAAKAAATKPEDLTIGELRALAKQHDIPLLGRMSKPEIISRIRAWEAGRPPILPGTAERRAAAVAARAAAEAAKEAADKAAAVALAPLPSSLRNPTVLTGQGGDKWWSLVVDDTGLTPIPVRNLTLDSGSFAYTVASGSAFRIRGVVYFVEDGTDTVNSVESIVRSLWEVHQTLPAEAVQHQKGYAWLGGRNPADAYWAQRYNTPGFTSAMTAGDGGTHVWDQSWTSALPTTMANNLRHEFGHNLSGGSVGSHTHGLHDTGQQWADAGRSDESAAAQVTIVTFKQGAHTGKQITLAPDPSKGYPRGVTDYGQSSAMEDFAESVRLYLAGELGVARLRPGGPEVAFYFRDVWPARAAHLDLLLPKVAAEQKLALARLGR
jgi:hypothetical protein